MPIAPRSRRQRQPKQAPCPSRGCSTKAKPKPRSKGKRKRSNRKVATLVTDPETSARLGRIHQKDTEPEMAVRAVLHSMGLRYRVRNRDLPGSPDIANRKKKWAVFVHGCFWHRHARCSRATTPKRNAEFWRAKFVANRARDRRVIRKLRGMGFEVVVIWECETKKMGGLTGLLDGLEAH